MMLLRVVLSLVKQSSLLLEAKAHAIDTIYLIQTKKSSLNVDPLLTQMKTQSNLIPFRASVSTCLFYPSQRDKKESYKEQFMKQRNALAAF